jgi:hypothetical protein
MRLFRSSSLVVFCLLLSACEENPLVKAINIAFPPADRTEQAITALETSQSNLATLKQQNISVTFRASDLQSIVAKAIAEKAPQVSITAMSLRRQRISIEATIETTLTDEHIKIAGRLVGTALVAVRPRALVLTPNFDRIEVSKIEYKGSKATDILAPIINNAVRSFIENINGQLKPIAVAIDLDRAFEWDLAKAFGSAPDLKVDAPPIRLHLGLVSAAILIDDDGLNAIGSLAVYGEDPPVDIAAECAAGYVTPNISCPTKTAGDMLVKPLCELHKAQRLAAAQVEAKAFQEICAATQTVTPVVAKITPRNEDAFDNAFKKFKTDFSRAQFEILGEQPSGNSTQVALTKSLIAVVLNRTLGAPNIHVKLTMSPPQQSFSEDIRLAKAQTSIAIKTSVIAISTKAAHFVRAMAGIVAAIVNGTTLAVAPGRQDARSTRQLQLRHVKRVRDLKNVPAKLTRKQKRTTASG